MPRTKYQITADDCQHARFYLSGKLRNYDIEIDDYAKAEKDYQEATLAKGRKKEAELLNAWAEKYLASEEWHKLKAAIRKRRQRWEHYGEQKTITISTKAHKLLNRIAERDQVTFSEVLEHYLSKAIRSSRGLASSVRKRRRR